MANTEIERKWIVWRMPPDREWTLPFSDQTISQLYLTAPEGVTERVREIWTDDQHFFTHTAKKRVGPATHIEDPNEEILTEAEYRALVKRADPTKRAIVKTRRTFDFAGKVLELDRFVGFRDDAGGGDLLLLEVEVASLDVVVDLPPFLDVVREVTFDRSFSNAALASMDAPHYHRDERWRTS